MLTMIWNHAPTLLPAESFSTSLPSAAPLGRTLMARDIQRSGVA
jgi:hypothetical protein